MKNKFIGSSWWGDGICVRVTARNSKPGFRSSEAAPFGVITAESRPLK